MTKYQPSLYSNVEELAGMSQAVSLEAENTHLWEKDEKLDTNSVRQSGGLNKHGSSFFT